MPEPLAATILANALAVIVGQNNPMGIAGIADPSRDLLTHASAEFTFDPTASADLVAPDASTIPRTSRDVSLGIFDESASQPEETAPNGNPFLHQGSWRWQLTGYLASDFNDVSLGAGGIAFSYFMEDNLSIEFEFTGLYINQEDDASNTGAVSASMLFRWHFMIDEHHAGDSPHWSIYAEAGAGMLYAGSDVPLDGSHFNFTPQAGIGASLLIHEASDARLLTGIRWFHISNANVFDANDGVDSFMVYAGINFPF